MEFGKDGPKPPLAGQKLIEGFVRQEMTAGRSVDLSSFDWQQLVHGDDGIYRVNRELVAGVHYERFRPDHSDGVSGLP